MKCWAGKMISDGNWTMKLNTILEAISLGMLLQGGMYRF